jgi:hypothetical protein
MIELFGVLGTSPKQARESGFLLNEDGSPDVEQLRAQLENPDLPARALQLITYILDESILVVPSRKERPPQTATSQSPGYAAKSTRQAQLDNKAAIKLEPGSTVEHQPFADTGEHSIARRHDKSFEPAPYRSNMSRQHHNIKKVAVLSKATAREYVRAVEDAQAEAKEAEESATRKEAEEAAARNEQKRAAMEARIEALPETIVAKATAKDIREELNAKKAANEKAFHAYMKELGKSGIKAIQQSDRATYVPPYEAAKAQPAAANTKSKKRGTAGVGPPTAKPTEPDRAAASSGHYDSPAPKGKKGPSVPSVSSPYEKQLTRLEEGLVSLSNEDEASFRHTLNYHLRKGDLPSAKKLVGRLIEARSTPPQAKIQLREYADNLG